MDRVTWERHCGFVRMQSEGDAERRVAPRSGPGTLVALIWACILFAGPVGLSHLWAQAPQENPPAEKAPKEKAAEEKAPEEKAAQPSADEKSSKTYTVRNGNVTYGRTEESERKKTATGEIETQRVRMPSFSGDRRILIEREIRTKRLPDGTVEKEYVLRNPDGSERLVPTEIIREKITQKGESTSVEREVLKPDGAGHWNPVRRERETAAGPEAAQRKVKEVREPSLEGGWRIVDRQVTTEKASQGKKESRTVRQLPDAYGRLADYEVRHERTTTAPNKETREVTLRRRDFLETINPNSYLVERTVSEQTKSADGRTTVKSTTESDMLAGGASRNLESTKPRVVEEEVKQESPGKGGSTRTVINVKERGVADPAVRPSYQVVQETDRTGHVRQIFVELR